MREQEKATGDSLAKDLRPARSTPRERFAGATPEDKRRRSLLFGPGQVRLFNDGRRVIGPVKLLYGTATINPASVTGGFTVGERVWYCELMYADETADIGEYSLGAELTEMEAIAWASVRG